MVAAPVTTSAKGWGPLGTLKERTVTVQVPVPGLARKTCSSVLRRSAAPPVLDWPPAKTLPSQVAPPGPLTARSRSLFRCGLAAGVEG